MSMANAQVAAGDHTVRYKVECIASMLCRSHKHGR